MLMTAWLFPKASAKGSSSNCVAHRTQHNNTTSHHSKTHPSKTHHSTTHHSKTYAATRRHTSRPAYVVFLLFPKASAKGSSSNCVAHTTQHNTTQHHTTARHTPARPTTAPDTTARHTPQQDATPPDRLMLYSYYILNYFLAGGRIGAT